MNLNPAFTFDDFIVGPANQMAHSASKYVAQRPGGDFNPLFIHGSCGLGKTHLLQAICHEFMAQYPLRKCHYVAGEQFVNELTEARETLQTAAFRERYRGLQLLAVDDVHFLSGEWAQLEFLHTFNALVSAGAQVVLVSDCGPGNIPSLMDPLSSRFLSGMVLRVDPPDVVTRLEILKRRAARMGVKVAEEHLAMIAQADCSNVREMEGLLLQVIASGTMHQPGGAFRPASFETIVGACESHFLLPAGSIQCPRRHRRITIARALAMHLARKHAGMSYQDIGNAMGGRNHTTVMAACQKVGIWISKGEMVWGSCNRHESVVDIIRALEKAIRQSSLQRACA
jgi:chromosomal replication initiator protein